MCHVPPLSLFSHTPFFFPIHVSCSSLRLFQCNWKTRSYRLNTLTSKNALSLLLLQNPWALISSLVLSSVLAVLSLKASPVNVWRCGSAPTLKHTSVKSWAVMSLILSWLIDGYAPSEQLKACSVVKGAPHEQ